VPGQIGLVQAAEVIKSILGIGTPMIGKFYNYNPLTLTSRIIEIGKNPDCPLCGELPRIRGLAGDKGDECEVGQSCGL
jgi:molybdopterin/thiamine biosynthesis adenylyltransferase